jgi:hypothetical protein
MKDKMVLFSVIISVVCLLVGVVAKLMTTKILVQGFTWMQVAQTILLLAIALGIGKLLDLNKK